MEFEWNIFPAFTTLQLCHKVQELLSRLSVTPEKFTGRVIFMSMFNDISWRSKDNKKECESNAQLVSLHAKRLGAGQWSFLDLHTQSSDPRVHCPEERSKSKGGRKLSIHCCADSRTIETVFRTVSVNQLSLYGAVAEMCVECDSCYDTTGRLVVEGRSNPFFVPSVMKTNIHLTDDPAQEEDQLRRYRERIEKLPQQDRVSKFCTDAGFLTTVEVGQYFMTRDTDEFSQFAEPVTCREYTLPRDAKSTDPKGWIRGNTEIGPQ